LYAITPKLTDLSRKTTERNIFRSGLASLNEVCEPRLVIGECTGSRDSTVSLLSACAIVELLRQQFQATRWSTSYAEMADAVQPDSTTVQQLLKRSRSLWSSYAAATTDLRLPAECIQLRKLLGRVPAFPTSSLQAHNKLFTLRYHHSRFGLRISGTSTWRTSLGECNLPPKILCHKLLCGVYNSVGCSFAEQSHFMDWPGV
jgi:hypothetical protein